MRGVPGGAAADVSVGHRAGKLATPVGPPQIPQEYDLQHSLSAIRKHGRGVVDFVERTNTDIRIESVIVNVQNTTEANSETETKITSNYATEQYVESLVNNLKADQKSNNTQLTESFNKKIDSVNVRIDVIKEKYLSKGGFWGGIALVVAIIGIIIGFLLHDLQGPRNKIDYISDTLEQQSKRIQTIEEDIISLSDSIDAIQGEIKEIKNPKKKK